MMVGATSLHDGVGVVELSEADEGMGATAGKQRAIELDAEPGHERLKPAREQGKDERWNRRKLVGVSRQIW